MKKYNVNEMYEEYKQGKTLEQIGKENNLVKSWISDLFKKNNFSVRVRKPRKIQEFNGKIYSETNTHYFRLKNANRQYMHTDVWTNTYGKKPKGYEIHHIDHNRGNNDINNLQLLKTITHKSKSRETKSKYSKKTYYGGWVFLEEIKCANCNSIINQNNPRYHLAKTTGVCSKKCFDIHYLWR